jgi:hypothetical protein
MLLKKQLAKLIFKPLPRASADLAGLGRRGLAAHARQHNDMGLRGQTIGHG